MKRINFAAVLVAAASGLATPAFASGYGPSPFYRAEEGAPVSQAGMRSQPATADETTRAGKSGSNARDIETATPEHIVDADMTARSYP